MRFVILAAAAVATWFALRRANRRNTNTDDLDGVRRRPVGGVNAGPPQSATLEPDDRSGLLELDGREIGKAAEQVDLRVDAHNFQAAQPPENYRTEEPTSDTPVERLAPSAESSVASEEYSFSAEGLGDTTQQTAEHAEPRTEELTQGPEAQKGKEPGNSPVSELAAGTLQNGVCMPAVSGEPPIEHGAEVCNSHAGTDSDSHLPDIELGPGAPTIQDIGSQLRRGLADEETERTSEDAGTEGQGLQPPPDLSFGVPSDASEKVQAPVSGAPGSAVSPDGLNGAVVTEESPGGVSWDGTASSTQSRSGIAAGERGRERTAVPTLQETGTASGGGTQRCSISF